MNSRANKTGKKTVRVQGINACAAVAAVRPDDIERVFLEERVMDRFRGLLRDRAAARRAYKVVSRDELERFAGGVHHEGVCFEVRRRPPPRWDTWRDRVAQRSTARVLYLDGVRNPHNLGAILRTAAHFGVSALLCDADDAPSLGPAAMRIAEGGAEFVPVVRLPNPREALEELRARGFAVVAADAHHERGVKDLYAADLPARVVFAMGAERTGLSAAIMRDADLRVSIVGTGDVESLNVGAATAVMLAEHARRHGP